MLSRNTRDIAKIKTQAHKRTNESKRILIIFIKFQSTSKSSGPSTLGSLGRIVGLSWIFEDLNLIAI